MVSALIIGPCSHRFQNRAEEMVSRALRLPKRAQNIARAHFRISAVGVRGCLSLVGNFVEHLAGKVKHLLGIADQTVEQVLHVPGNFFSRIGRS